MAARKKNKGSLFSTAVILIGLLIIVLVFLAKKDQILTNFKDTDFFGRVFGSTPQFVEKHESSSETVINQKGQQKDEVLELVVNTEEEKLPEQQQNPAPAVEKPAETVTVPAEKVSGAAEKEQPAEKKTQKEETKKESVKPATTDLQLCFITIDADGSFVRKIITRSVPKTDSPLVTAINQLLKGPDPTSSKEKNFRTYIPEGSRLLGASISNGTATLNFSEEFNLNTQGNDGIMLQLMQVVYTATSFPTVRNVQIKVEGEIKNYLGEDFSVGFLDISHPLSRSSF